MILKFGTYEIKSNSKFFSPETNRTITFIDAFFDGTEHYVVVKHHTSVPEILAADNFANYISQGIYRTLPTAKYKPGDRFTHGIDNASVEILSASPLRSDSIQALIYFVELISPLGELSYSAIDEAYLDTLDRLPNSDVALPRPDVLLVDYTFELIEE